MKNIDVILGKDHLEDISSAKPIPAIKEIIWNAFDSNSLIVKVLFHKYSNANTIEKVTIQDQGEGIPHHNVSLLFGSLGESWKKDAKKKWRSFFTRSIWKRSFQGIFSGRNSRLVNLCRG